jgi:hypothetical protein
MIVPEDGNHGAVSEGNAGRQPVQLTDDPRRLAACQIQALFNGYAPGQGDDDAVPFTVDAQDKAPRPRIAAYPERNGAALDVEDQIVLRAFSVHMRSPKIL